MQPTQTLMPPARQVITREQARDMAVAKPSALAIMATRLNVEPNKLMDALKATVFKKATNEELLCLVVVSNEYGLNPLLKEIYAFPGKDGGIVPVISIDGWLKMVNRHIKFDGVEFEMTESQDGKPYACTCTLFVKDRTRPVRITEYYEECFRNTDPWKNMPRRMLRHKALIQAGRVAFGFSGVHDEDEAIDVVSSVIPEPTRQIADTDPTPAPAPEGKPKAAKKAPEDQVADLLKENGFTVDQLLKVLEKEEWIKDATALGSLEDLDSATLTRVTRATQGILASLNAMFPKDGGAQ